MRTEETHADIDVSTDPTIFNARLCEMYYYINKGSRCLLLFEQIVGLEKGRLFF